MSTTGELKKTSEDSFEGFIADLGFDTEVSLRRNKDAKHDRSPDFIVYGKSPRGRQIRIGAAWEKVSQAENNFLSLTINVMGNQHNVNALYREQDGDMLDIRAWAE